MNKAKILLVLAFVVVCAAGVVVGTAVDWHVHPMMAPHGPLDVLHLSPEQESQVRTAWEQVAQQRGQMFHKRREMEDHRWDAIQKLFTPEQKQQFDQIQTDYHHQTRELDTQLSSAVAQATEQMKTILTPEQFKAWDQMRKDHGFGRDKHGPGMGSTKMGPPGLTSGIGPPGMGLPHTHHHHATTRPSTDPSVSD